MGKQDRLKNKLLSNPKTFLWSDLCIVMKNAGFEMIKNGGSRRKFINKQTNQFVSWHEPHPGNEVKKYVIKEAIRLIKECEDE